MYIIVIPLERIGKESYYRKGYVGNLPRTIDRRTATQFKSETYAETIAKNLRIKHMDKEFNIEPY